MSEAIASLSQFDNIISEVRNQNLDPKSGLAQGEALGKTLRDNYLQQANSLKDNENAGISP